MTHRLYLMAGAIDLQGHYCETPRLCFRNSVHLTAHSLGFPHPLRDIPVLGIRSKSYVEVEIRIRLQRPRTLLCR